MKEPQMVMLQCWYCQKSKSFPEDSCEANSGCNYFCSGDCEDRFAWYEEPYKPSHKTMKNESEL